MHDIVLGLPFPENVQAIEEECGIQSVINISWEVSISVDIHNCYNEQFQCSQLVSVNT